MEVLTTFFSACLSEKAWRPSSNYICRERTRCRLPGNSTAQLECSGRISRYTPRRREAVGGKFLLIRSERRDFPLMVTQKAAHGCHKSEDCAKMKYPPAQVMGPWGCAKRFPRESVINLPENPEPLVGIAEIRRCSVYQPTQEGRWTIEAVYGSLVCQIIYKGKWCR